jgi:hypothetical protein
MDLPANNIDSGDGAGSGAHAYGDARSLKGGACGRGGALEAVTIADNNLSIGSQVDQYLPHPARDGSQYTGQGVTA